MKLTDKLYNSLRKDEDIVSWVEGLSESYQMNDEERKKFTKKQKKISNELFDSSIDILENLQNEEMLMMHLGVDKQRVQNVLRLLISTRDSGDFYPKRITSKSEISKIITFMFVRLRELGLNSQARRVDFVVQVYLDCDFESLLTISEQYEGETSSEELDLRERLRKLDSHSQSSHHWRNY